MKPTVKDVYVKQRNNCRKYLKIETLGKETNEITQEKKQDIFVLLYHNLGKEIWITITWT